MDAGGVQHGMILRGENLTTVDRQNCLTSPGPMAIAFYGINRNGRAAGWCTDSNTGASDAFSYSKGKFVTISPPGATSTQAHGINDAGHIVGTFLDANKVQHGFLLSGGKYKTLDVPGTTATNAWGINDQGLITLFAINGKGNYDSFLFDGTSYTMIDVPGQSQNFVAEIDATGDRVYTVVDSGKNSHGALFLNLNGGTFTVFDDPKGKGTTEALGLNDNLEIVGTLHAQSHGRTTGSPIARLQRAWLLQGYES